MQMSPGVITHLSVSVRCKEVRLGVLAATENSRSQRLVAWQLPDVVSFRHFAAGVSAKLVKGYNVPPGFHFPAHT